MSIDSYKVNKASWKFLILIHTFLKRLAIHLLETIKFKKQGGGTFRAVFGVLMISRKPQALPGLSRQVIAVSPYAL